MNDKEIALELLKIADKNTHSLNDLKENVKSVCEVYDTIKSHVVR